MTRSKYPLKCITKNIFIVTVYIYYISTQNNVWLCSSPWLKFNLSNSYIRILNWQVAESIWYRSEKRNKQVIQPVWARHTYTSQDGKVQYFRCGRGYLAIFFYISWVIFDYRTPTSVVDSRLKPCRSLIIISFIICRSMSACCGDLDDLQASICLVVPYDTTGAPELVP